MLFNSAGFAIFLPVVFALYWGLSRKSLKLQNGLLLAASYYFYACWDWRFLFVLIFSTLLDYYTGIRIENALKTNHRRFWLWLSIIINAGFLGVFKYYNFFADSFAEASSHLGLSIHPKLLEIVLPVGISFYTFHGLSYVIDIHKSRIRAERNFVDYSLFVSFFPLLVAGPIERATHLLPQLKEKRPFDQAKATDGLRQILWGFFKKVVIADNCAHFANLLFDTHSHSGGSTLVLGAMLFAIQIYGDFSGYSDIALGTARLFGIDLLRNFSHPYFSRNIAEFWRRWHISLSSWFRDYLYIPLGGSKGGTWQKIRNVFIIFLVSGFWHGANWTFIVWGLLHAIYMMPSVLLNRNRRHMEIVAQHRSLPNVPEILSMAVTFSLVCFAWIFFRAENLSHALDYISRMCSGPMAMESTFLHSKMYPFYILIVFFFCIEWIGRRQPYAIASLFLSNVTLRWGFYYLLLAIILVFAALNQQFIYFQF
ncbi:MBOAT family O-acyltransferase [Flavobacterium silvaticum]|uniref:MBOAT family protein n=1 Tax=Flavobacterium silvaticum TaxID=1852020 RepID=A0A972G1L7_9FLAO|nr:MBOAT family protein [Flavobacterium silvaticum]NMH28791.1 MBOAT family protein [Flavobacterium silvaticum]